jgi:hypothetical protein
MENKEIKIVAIDGTPKTSYNNSVIVDSIPVSPKE